MEFVNTSPSTGLFTNLDEAAIYKNEFLLDGAAIFFPELDPVEALEQQFVYTKKVKKREVQKTTTVARYVAALQGRVHNTLRIAIVR